MYLAKSSAFSAFSCHESKVPAVTWSTLGRYSEFCAPLTKVSKFLLTISFAVIVSPSAALIRESVLSSAFPMNFDRPSTKSSSSTIRQDQRIVSVDSGVESLGSDHSAAVEGSISDIWSFNSRITQCKDIEV